MTRFFPLIAVLFTVLAYLNPVVFSSLKPAIVPLLMLIMLAMALDLKAKDFKYAVYNYKVVTLGLVLQFLVMPLLALIISYTLQLDQDLMIGLVLLGSVSSGKASNVICYLAQANVALSITLTLFSGLLSILLTPILVKLYLDASIPVPVESMILSILKINLIPIGVGLLLNHFFEDKLKSVKQVLPSVSIFAICLIIGIVVGLSKEKLSIISTSVVIAVLLHNLGGFSIAYFLASVLKINTQNKRTLTIEVAMQNSGLAMVLAIKYFNAIAALPSVLFSIWHNISGAILASIWKKNSHQ